MEQLVKQDNDYLVAVKGNQPKLCQQFQTALANQQPEHEHEEIDSSHGRQVTRIIKVFAAPETLAQTWHQAKSLVVVDRQGIREGQAFETRSFHLSSVELTALIAGMGIRRHRDIENGLHWVRDVIFQEDNAPFKGVAPALNWSVLRSFALNLFRANGFSSLTKAIRFMGHDLLKLFSLMTKN